MARRLPQERGTLLAAMAQEHLWSRMPVAFGLTKMTRNNCQSTDRDRERELTAERPLTDQISGAKAAQVTPALGILLEAAQRVHRLIPTPEVFG